MESPDTPDHAAAVQPVPSVPGQPALLRRLNERAVFELIRSRGSVSRVEIKRHLGVSGPTISKAVTNLLEAGLVEQIGMTDAKTVGRPGRVYRLATHRAQVIGVRLDVRKCYVLTAALDGQINESQIVEFKTPQTYKQMIRTAAEHIKRFIGENVQTLGIGVSIPGGIDLMTGKVLLSPNLHVLDGQTPAADLETLLGMKVVLVHDTLGTCLAELAYGRAKGLRDFVIIGIGEGYGVAVVVNGRPLFGSNGMAGEMGHITVDPNGILCGCGNRGCLETVATDAAFARRVNQRIGADLDIDEIVKRCAEGKLNADAELNETMEYIAIGVGAAINTFNPSAVLVCSRMFDVSANAFDRLIQMAQARALSPLARSCRIIRTALDVRQGAIAGVLDHLTTSLAPGIDL